jgi:hypothetical protein
MGLQGVQKVGEQFDADGVTLRMRMASDRLGAFAHALREVSRGRLALQASEELDD